MVVLREVIRLRCTWMTELDLYRRVADSEAFANPSFELTHDVFRIRQRLILDHYVCAERGVLRRYRPNVEVVNSGDATD